MSKQKKTKELEVGVILEEPLTSDSCCKLILELVKYLLYQKQQIPVTYEYLLRLGAPSSGASERSLATARNTLSCLQNISDHLNRELTRGNAVVKEIAVFMGATILSPKLCVRISLPPGILSGRRHYGEQHSTRKPLLNLMRSVTESQEFQDAMTSPLLPTNTFVLVQKYDCNRVSEFFLPKPRFVLPSVGTGSCFHLRLGYRDDSVLDCNCANTIRVYQDPDSSSPDLGTSQDLAEQKIPEERDAWFEDTTYQWYQSRDIIRGFKLSR